MSEEPIKLFISGACGPCQQIKKLVQEGKFNQPKVDLVDVETDEGFPYIEKMGIQKVPSAFKGTKVCQLSIDEDILVIDCGEEPESPQ